MVKVKEFFKNLKGKTVKANAIDYVLYMLLMFGVVVLFAFCIFKINLQVLKVETRDSLYFTTDTALSAKNLTINAERDLRRRDIVTKVDGSTDNVTAGEEQEIRYLVEGKIVDGTIDSNCPGIFGNFNSFFNLDESTHLSTYGIWKNMCKNKPLYITDNTAESDDFKRAAIIIYQPIYSVQANVVGYETKTVTTVLGGTKTISVPIIHRDYVFDTVKVFFVFVTDNNITTIRAHRYPADDAKFTYTKGKYNALTGTVVPTTYQLFPDDGAGHHKGGARIDVGMKLEFYGMNQIFASLDSDDIFVSSPTRDEFEAYVRQSLDIVTVDNDDRQK